MCPNGLSSAAPCVCDGGLARIHVLRRGAVVFDGVFLVEGRDQHGFWYPVSVADGALAASDAAAEMAWTPHDE